MSPQLIEKLLKLVAVATTELTAEVHPQMVEGL